MQLERLATGLRGELEMPPKGELYLDRKLFGSRLSRKPKCV